MTSAFYDRTKIAQTAVTRSFEAPARDAILWHPDQAKLPSNAYLTHLARLLSIGMNPAFISYPWGTQIVFTFNAGVSNTASPKIADTFDRMSVWCLEEAFTRAIRPISSTVRLRSTETDGLAWRSLGKISRRSCGVEIRGDYAASVTHNKAGFGNEIQLQLFARYIEVLEEEKAPDDRSCGCLTQRAFCIGLGITRLGERRRSRKDLFTKLLVTSETGQFTGVAIDVSRLGRHWCPLYC